MCAGCAMAAASAASGFRTWMQSQGFDWLTPRRMRALTIAAMCAAATVSSIGLGGSAAPATRSSGSARPMSRAALSSAPAEAR